MSILRSIDALEVFVNPQALPSNLVEALFEFLRRGDVASRFCSAPASTKLSLHHAYPGGLFDHSKHVFELMQRFAAAGFESQCSLTGHFKNIFNVEKSTDSPISIAPAEIAVAALLHDIAKIGDHNVDHYIPAVASVKTGKVSTAIPYQTNPNAWNFEFCKVAGPVSHQAAAIVLADLGGEYIPEGIRSLALIKLLSPDFFSLLSDDVKFAITHHDGLYGGARSTFRAHETPMSLLLHWADMWSSQAPKWVRRSTDD